MSFSKLNLICCSAVCPWPQIYPDPVATPRALTSTSAGRRAESEIAGEMCPSLYHLFHNYPHPWSLPPYFYHSLCFVLFFIIPHIYPLCPSLPALASSPPPNMLAAGLSEVMKGSVSLGLGEPVSGWCNYDGWSNFQRCVSVRALAHRAFSRL